MPLKCGHSYRCLSFKFPVLPRVFKVKAGEMSEKKMSCIAYCTCKKFLFKELCDFYIQNQRAILYRDVLHIKSDEGNIFIFSYGIIVSWNISHDRIQRILVEIQRFEDEHFDESVMDEFTFSTGEGNMRVHEDHIYFDGGDVIEELAVSHGIAQSLKLSTLESYAQKTIEGIVHIPSNIAKKGKSQMSRKEISRMRGNLFLVEMDINLTFELLDTPEFFWEYPELEYLYEKTVKYLDVRARIEILNTKLHVIREIFNMLADEQNHKHSAVLEWIIIWLIALEIVLFIIKAFLPN